MNTWTSEDIAKILIQLDKMNLPFKQYSVVNECGHVNLLGRGGFSEVYETKRRSSHKSDYAMKVIGFQKQNPDSDSFFESAQAQRTMTDYQNNIVKIYDYNEFWILLDEKDNVTGATQEKPEGLLRTIKLQFIVMEKISPIIETDNSGKIIMTPMQLSFNDEQEVLNLAYDVGSAIKKAHNMNVLHRDIKLENVFYSHKHKKYKLGDFGIAKKTDDGFASTIAFTKGYAAPEVRTAVERYDNTADIYSFGIMLYVLMNSLKFPDSKTYTVNSQAQYHPGYVVPYPEGKISEEFYHVIAKACMYIPDQRYQSMDELMLDLEKLIHSNDKSYLKEHKVSPFVLGSILLAVGTVFWRLTLVSDIAVSFSFWQYAFIAACMGKGIQKIFKKNYFITYLIVFFIGLHLLISSGFSWIKLLFLLWMSVSSGTSAGLFSIVALIINVTSVVQHANGGELYINKEYSWVAITLISLAVVLIHYYDNLATEERKNTKENRKDSYWIWIYINYLGIMLMGLLVNSTVEQKLAGTVLEGIINTDLIKVGICGLVFCFVWNMREKILIWFHKQKREKINEWFH